MSVAPGASPGFMSPAIVRARPARRVECGPDLDGNDGLPWVARGLREHHAPSTHPIIFDPPGGSPLLTMGRSGPRVSPGATHVRPAYRGSPEGFWWSMKARAHPTQRMIHRTVPHANDHQITTFNVRCPHGGNEPPASSLDYDYSVTPDFLPIFGRIFATPSDELPTPSSTDTVSAFTTKTARRCPANAGLHLATLFATGRTCRRHGIAARSWSERSFPFDSGYAGLGIPSTKSDVRIPISDP